MSSLPSYTSAALILPVPNHNLQMIADVCSYVIHSNAIPDCPVHKTQILLTPAQGFFIQNVFLSTIEQAVAPVHPQLQVKIRHTLTTSKLIISSAFDREDIIEAVRVAAARAQESLDQVRTLTCCVQLPRDILLSAASRHFLHHRSAALYVPSPEAERQRPLVQPLSELHVYARAPNDWPLELVRRTLRPCFVAVGLDDAALRPLCLATDDDPWIAWYEVVLPHMDDMSDDALDAARLALIDSNQHAMRDEVSLVELPLLPTQDEHWTVAHLVAHRDCPSDMHSMLVEFLSTCRDNGESLRVRGGVQVDEPVMVECVVCLDEFLLSRCLVCPATKSPAVELENKHAVCPTCLRACVAQLEPNAQLHQGLACLGRDGAEQCASVYPTRQLEEQLDDAAYTHWRELQHAAVRLEAEAERRAREAAAAAERSRLSALDRARRDAIHEVSEHVLTDHCPHPTCGVAVLDWDGCNAVKCSSCRGHFCGRCFSPAADSAAAHACALRCGAAAGRAGYFGDPSENRRGRHQRALNSYWAGLSPEMRGMVRPAIVPLLEGTGVTLPAA